MSGNLREIKLMMPKSLLAVTDSLKQQYAQGDKANRSLTFEALIMIALKSLGIAVPTEASLEPVAAEVADQVTEEPIANIAGEPHGNLNIPKTSSRSFVIGD